MTARRPVALAHGGAENDPAHADGPRRAAQAARDAMRAGGTALDAVVEAVRLLEDDPRFNAGTGSNLRLDGRTVHMDACVLDSAGRLAIVIGLHDVRNPVLVARDLLATPHRALAGPGATRFARRMGHAPHDPRTPGAGDRAADAAGVRGSWGAWPM
ncbi:MAG TPA: isoaspartyl peptidase/L-asparaginase, partial [Candidatus Thermoplasmatota archaeon]|nr:isoaspartyl peptidase/L-asparaginase [Candidatus Thermoplasmatota archaeon]